MLCMIADCVCAGSHFALLQVDTLREECNKNIDKMGVEIHRLEQVRTG